MKYKELNQITKVEQINPRETYYHIGDNFIISVSKVEHDFSSKYDSMNVWKKCGYITNRLKTHIFIDTYYTDKSGTCYGWYNPTVKLHPSGGRMVIDFDYLKEYNEENVNFLLAACIRAFNNDEKIRR